MTAITVPARPVLADLLPFARQRTTARAVVLVIAGALFMAVASQIRIPLGFTPVPINLGTFAAVLVGGGLGVRRGVASMGLFLFLGAIGLPFYAGGQGGWDAFTGATGGYLFAYPLMAAMIGLAAQRGSDRKVVPFVSVVVLANVALYAIGAWWLARVVGVPMLGSGKSAWTMGIAPFLAGDIAKMIAAGVLLPTAWKFLGDR